MTDNDVCLKLLNASGFAFQLAVESSVCRPDSGHSWRVVAREHRWATSRGFGYIDFVLAAANVHLVVECKRTMDATWLFLLPDSANRSRSRARIGWTSTFPNRPDLAGWDDIQLYPHSPESEFCVVRGQGESDRPLLERLGAAVCDAADGLCADLITLSKPGSAEHIVIPVIVTNAKLLLAEFDADGVDLDSGRLAAAAFTSVSSVRFRKGMGASSPSSETPPAQLRDLAASSERTVLVVHSAEFAGWLREFQIGAPTAMSPWEVARRKSNVDAGYG